MDGLQTEFDFTLPKGYVDSSGTLHRRGTMRLATARDEIEPLRDQRISGPDDPFLTVVVLSRVITRLGTISQVTPREIENLFAADLAYLQDLNGINNVGTAEELAELRRSTMPAPEAVAAPSYDEAEADVDEGADDEDDDEIVMAAPRRHAIQEVRSSAVE